MVLSNKRVIFFGALLFLLIRLVFLTKLPIFNDEGSYLEWGNLFWKNLGLNSVPVSLDGKQMGVPILWGLVQFLPLDPLIAGRLLIIGFSLVTYLAIVFLANKIYKQKYVFTLLSLLLSFCPYLILFDRLALPDSAIAALYSLGALLALDLAERPTILKSIILGLIIALGWWLKSTILLIFPPLAFLYIYKLVKRKDERSQFIVSFISIMVTFIILILPVILNPMYSKFSHFELTRFLSLREIVGFPLNQWLINFCKVLLYLLVYITPLILIVFIVGVKNIIHQKSLLKILLFVAIPLIFEILLLRNIDARYLLLTVPLLLLLTVEGIKVIWERNKFLVYIPLASVFIISLILISSPLKFYSLLKPLPVVSSDFGQYVTGWTSGYGVKEASEFIKKQVAGRGALVFVRLDSGNPEDAIYVYLKNEKNILVLPVGYLEPMLKKRKELNLRGALLYFVSRGPQYGGVEPLLIEEAKFQKPIGDEFVGVYKIRP